MAELDKWESRLKPFFESHLRIIGEIPISETDLDELAEAVREFLDVYRSFARGTQKLIEHYPFVFLTLLAHFSAHNDQAGYWQALQQRVGADQDLHISRWHQHFVALAKKHGLRTFSEADTPNFYVATIRFHGGIPTYSLPDFFDRMVIPAVEDKNLREIASKDALAYLLKHVQFVDRPVLDFLENSGEMGLTWFESCCKLVGHARKNHGEVLPIAQVPELPYYIYSFFEQYNEGLQDRGFHWSRPYLEVSPFSEDSPVGLHIPDQIVPIEVANQSLHWSITWPELKTPLIIPCQMVHRRTGESIKEDFRSITCPTSQITVSIFSSFPNASEDTELRRWTIPLLPSADQAPLIAFRENCRHIPNAQTLPAQVLYLLIPASSALEVDGHPKKVDSFGTFAGDWGSWKLEQWDLSSAVSLLMYQDGMVLGNIIPVASEIAQPELTGGHLFDYQEYPDQLLYTSESPSISIPVAQNLSKHQALAGWTLSVTSIGEASPNIDTYVSLQDYQAQCSYEAEQILFPLKELLGEKPAGIYDLKLTGPKKVKAEFRLRLWPKLLVQNYSKEFPSPIESREPVRFNLHLQENAWVENQPGADLVEIRREDYGITIIAKPEVRRAQLDLITLSETKTQIRVPVSIPVMRLRWGIAEENSSVKFSQNVVHISKERFAQYSSSAIHVEMRGLSEIISKLSCQLVGVDNEENILQEAKFNRTGFSPDWLRASLLQFSGTIQDLNTPAQFQLVYQKDLQSPQIRYALLEVSPLIEVEDVKLQQIGECDWKLTWREDYPLKHRRVMLKSAWQPWQPVIEEKIPDENRGEFTFYGLSLPPSRYEVYFYIRRAWETSLTTRPEDGTCHQIDLCTPEERLTALDITQEEHDAAFQNCIERACILHSLGETEERDNSVSNAAKHLIHLQNVRILVESVKWMQSVNIASHIMSFFRKYMFHLTLITAILGRYARGDEQLATYLHMMDETIYADSARFLLNEVDDPYVISTCIKNLVKREDEDLVSMVLSMLDKGRLSADDAAYLLMTDTEHRIWAMEQICLLPQSSDSDSLLAAALPIYMKEKNEPYEDWLYSALLRVVRLEKSPKLIYHYIEILINSDRADAWQELLRLEKLGRITPQEFYELLRINPKKALLTLKQEVESDRYSDVIQKIEIEFPQAAGLLKPGMFLLTPFGQAQIISIQLSDGTEAQNVHLSDGNFMLYMRGGTGLDKVEVDLDFMNMTLLFRNESIIYRCSTCKAFCHPRLQKIDDHFRQSHPYASKAFQIISGPIPFTLNEISYLNQPD